MLYAAHAEACAPDRRHYDHWLKPAARDRARRCGGTCARSFHASTRQSEMPSLAAKGLLGLIQLYKWTLSPIIGRECRYLPTCSSYAADCVRAHGAWAGGWMAAARICRCHPLGRSGYDPAPEVKPTVRWWSPWAYGDWSWRPKPEPANDGAPRRS